MKPSTRLTLSSILLLACAGILCAQLPSAKQESVPLQQVAKIAPAEPTAADKLTAEIRGHLFPIQMHVSPNMFSRRALPARELNQLDIVLLSAPEAEVVPLQITIKRGKAAPVHYASARYNRTKKKLEMKFQPAVGDATWLAPAEWYKKSRPVS